MTWIQQRIDYIMGLGSAIVVTIGSFLIKPPLLNPNQQPVVNWISVFTFVIGLVSIILAKRLSKKHITAKHLIICIVLLIGLIITYEQLYSSYSKQCGDRETVRIIISHHAVKSTEQAHFDYWGKRSNDPLEALLFARFCEPEQVWDRKDLVIPYYSFLLTYFSIALVTCLTIQLSTKIRHEK